MAETAPKPQGSFDLDGRTALVTGAGRGIGEACAVALAAAGADLVLVGRTQDELARVAGRIEDLDRSVRALPCDVTQPEAIRALVADLDHVDILVNSAGSNIPEPFVEVTDAHLDSIMRVNVSGTFFASQAVARSMIDRGQGGSIINLSSQMGHIGAAGRTVYCTSKHAVEGLTKACAVELAPYEIRVNAVAPTYIETPMTRPFFEDADFRADSISKIPMGRLGEPGDVVGAVVYLASPASSLVTGTSLRVDGGYTAQ